MLRDATVVHGYRQQNMSVRAVEPPYGTVRNMTLSSGRWITGEDYQNKQRVAVIGRQGGGKAVWRELRPDGEIVSINGLQFQIIGVLKPRRRFRITTRRTTSACSFRSRPRHCCTTSNIRTTSSGRRRIRCSGSRRSRKCVACWRACITFRRTTSARSRRSFSTNS